MKKVFQFLVCVTIISTLNSQTPNHLWTPQVSDNVRTVCSCEMDKIMQNSVLRTSYDAKPNVISPNCRIHKPIMQDMPEDFYLSKKRKKVQTKRSNGSHIIWL